MHSHCFHHLIWWLLAKSARGGLVGSAENPHPNIGQHPLRENNFPMSIILKKLTELDVKASMGFAVVEGDEVLT